MVPARNKAKIHSLVNHATQTIQFLTKIYEKTLQSLKLSATTIGNHTTKTIQFLTNNYKKTFQSLQLSTTTIGNHTTKKIQFMTKIYEKTLQSLQLSTTTIGNITNESDIYNRVETWLSLRTVKIGEKLFTCYSFLVTFYLLHVTF